MAKIIQFMHPGGYSCKTDEITWNIGDHKRKLIKNAISYINGDVLHRNETGYFWGEWEPESYCEKINGYYVHTVKYPSLSANDFKGKSRGKCKSESGSPLNTDPYVFGDYFIYSNCMQPTYHALSELENDDIILFGSRSDGKFILDTLFVVERKLQPSEIVLDCFEKATYQFIKNDDFKIYKAKMYNPGNPGEMYSFFPCSLSPFERPVIDLGYLHSMKRGVCYIHEYEPALKSKDVWNDIVSAVKEKGLCIGVSANEPNED